MNHFHRILKNTLVLSNIIFASALFSPLKANSIEAFLTDGVLIDSSWILNATNSTITDSDYFLSVPDSSLFLHHLARPMVGIKPAERSRIISQENLGSFMIQSGKVMLIGLQGPTTTCLSLSVNTKIDNIIIANALGGETKLGELGYTVKSTQLLPPPPPPSPSKTPEPTVQQSLKPTVKITKEEVKGWGPKGALLKDNLVIAYFEKPLIANTLATIKIGANTDNIDKKDQINNSFIWLFTLEKNITNITPAKVAVYPSGSALPLYSATSSAGLTGITLNEEPLTKLKIISDSLIMATFPEGTNVGYAIYFMQGKELFLTGFVKQVSADRTRANIAWMTQEDVDEINKQVGS